MCFAFYYQSFDFQSPTFFLFSVLLSVLSMPLTSTPDSSSVESAEMDLPKNSTLNFLKQFARCYMFEPAVAPSLGSLVLN